MKKEFVNFICEIHGYLIRVKELHWHTSSNSEHLQCDDFHSELMELEDEFTECCMGLEGKKFEIGKLLPMLPNSTSFETVLSEFEKDVLKIKKTLSDIKYSGITNVLDDMVKLANKYKYRVTQK